MTLDALFRTGVLVTRPSARDHGQSRVHDQQSILAGLALAAYAVVQAIALIVAAGVMMFIQRDMSPTTDYQRDMGSTYVMMAVFAAVLVIAPLVSLGAGAARLGTLRRTRRLAILRLLGAGPSHVRCIGFAEAIIQAFIGAMIGTVIYLVTLPVWGAISFLGESLSASSMWIGIPGLVGVTAISLVIAAVSAVLGLSRVVITPLGVARRSDQPALRWIRVVIPVAFLFIWMIGGKTIGKLDEAIALAVAMGILGGLLLGMELAGPFVIQICGKTVARSASNAAGLIAGRRIADDPRSTWRAVGVLGVMSFTASFTALLPALSSDEAPGSDLFARDVSTGVYLTLILTFLVTAASTGLNQAAMTIDTLDISRALSLSGAPADLQTAVRRRQSLMPVVIAVVGGLVTGLFFQIPILGSVLISEPQTLVMLVVTVAIGVGLVALSEESCGPLQRRLLAEHHRNRD